MQLNKQECCNSVRIKPGDLISFSGYGYESYLINFLSSGESPATVLLMSESLADTRESCISSSQRPLPTSPVLSRANQ